MVLEDADVEQAVKAAIFGKFLHQGQICMAINRMLIWHCRVRWGVVSRLAQERF
uniref:aldehyde dehydrogenase family protein n=1 Tax=Marinobacter gelidimuriae TaxID=2739064 RepID=UPI0038993130